MLKITSGKYIINSVINKLNNRGQKIFFACVLCLFLSSFPTEQVNYNEKVSQTRRFTFNNRNNN